MHGASGSADDIPQKKESFFFSPLEIIPFMFIITIKPQYQTTSKKELKNAVEERSDKDGTRRQYFAGGHPSRSIPERESALEARTGGTFQGQPQDNRLRLETASHRRADPRGAGNRNLHQSEDVRRFQPDAPADSDGSSQGHLP